MVTDYTGINEMVDHGMGDLKTVSGLALKAGIDMDMVGEGFLTYITQLLKEGKITMQMVDAACRRILEAKYKLGLFDDPYRYLNEERAKTEIFTPEHRKIARQTAAQSFVLLKNQNNLLPLKKQGTVAVIGPLANNKVNMPGTWSVAAEFDKATSILTGLKEVIGDKVKFLYAKGCNLDADSVFEQRVAMFNKDVS